MSQSTPKGSTVHLNLVKALLVGAQTWVTRPNHIYYNYTGDGNLIGYSPHADKITYYPITKVKEI